MSYVNQRPDTCANRPFAAGIEDTPFSRYVFSSAPVMLTVNATLPNGSTPSTEPRVIGYAGGVNGGQKSSAMTSPISDSPCS